MVLRAQNPEPLAGQQPGPKNLDARGRQLRGAQIDVDVDPEEYRNGRFANLRDPEGNPLQLWQPAGADLRRTVLTSSP